MKRSLLFLSSLSAVTCLCVSAQSAPERAEVQKRAFQIQTPKATISGILLTRDEGETITGSMINEFGVSALDFVYSKPKDKVKLMSVISFLDKWYIKRVLCQDINYTLHVMYDMPIAKKTRYLTVTEADTISITNPKYHLTYTFSPLKEESPTDSISENDSEGQSL